MAGKTKFNIEVSREVHWGEMDALGHVNNARYFSYFEDARIEYFRMLGFKSVKLGEEKGPILAQIACNFRRPILYPDKLIVGVGTTKLGNSSMTLDYEVFSTSQGEIVADGSSVVVMMDYSQGKSTPIPDSLRNAIAETDRSLLV